MTATVITVPADYDPNRVPTRFHNYTATRDPLPTDDASQRYATGSLWMRGDTGELWRCRSAAVGAARWIRMDVADHPGYVAGRWYTLFGIGAVANSTVPTVDTIMFSFGVLKERVTISQLGIRVVTANASGSLQLAMYRADPATFMPGQLAASTGSLSMAAAVTVNSSLLQGNVTLEPGNYWFALNGNNGAGAYLSFAAGQSILASSIGSTTSALPSNAPITGFTRAQAFGTWPTEFVSGTAFTEHTTNRPPAAQFLVASVP